MARWGFPLMTLLLAVWAASLWGIGYLAVPVLFAELGDRQLAGRVAGVMFERGGGVAGVCALLFALCWWRCCGWRRRDPVVWLLAAAVLCAAAVLLGLQPAMAALKLAAAPLDVMQSPWRGRFIALHGVSSVLYLLESLALAGMLLLVARRGRDAPAARD